MTAVLCIHFTQEERTEEGKLALATALGAWTALCSTSAAAIARFSHGLTKEKEAVKRAHLHALLTALQQPTRTSTFDRAPPVPNTSTVTFLAQPLVPLLLKLVDEGLTKATARADGLTAALALALAAHEAPVLATITADAVRG